MLQIPSETLLTEYLPLLPMPGRADLLAHQCPTIFPFWFSWEAETKAKCDIPYWAAIWPAAQLMGKYLLAHPEKVRGFKVLDLGCGGGMVSIAAKAAGAREVLANDIDIYCEWMVGLNAQANGMEIKFSAENLLLTAPDSTLEMILVSDLFYDREVSAVLMQWLKQARKNGSRVLIADGSRPFGPKENVTLITEEIFETNFELEGRNERLVKLLELE